MQAPKFHESRLNFQFERFLFFSDGVFAICITLMVIDLKLPDHLVEGTITDGIIWRNILGMGLKFLGLAISFGIIGHYWSVHHRIFGYVIKYDTPLIWLNLCFLFSVALLPFTSGLLGQYSNDTALQVPYMMYVINICITGLFNCLLWLYVANPKRNFLTHYISPYRVRLGLYRSLILPIVFIISFLVAFVSPDFARFIPLSIPFVIHYGMLGVEKKMVLHETELENAPVEGSI
jgi:uncharacterized membrane protein